MIGTSSPSQPVTAYLPGVTSYTLLPIVAGVSVFPDLAAVGGADRLKAVAGAVLTVVLVAAVLMLIVSAIGWAVSSAGGNAQAATKSRMGLWVALGTAVLAGAGVAWLNFLVDIGRGI